MFWKAPWVLNKNFQLSIIKLFPLPAMNPCSTNFKTKNVSENKGHKKEKKWRCTIVYSIFHLHVLAWVWILKSPTKLDTKPHTNSCRNSVLRWEAESRNRESIEDSGPANIIYSEKNNKETLFPSRWNPKPRTKLISDLYTMYLICVQINTCKHTYRHFIHTKITYK